MTTILQNGVNGFLARYSDIALAALVIGMVGMMIIPLPTFLLDLLLTLNITLAVTLLMVSLYIPSALKIAAFPSILLITTLFRLALNVSSTRLILLQADAGQVIASFGHFVVQGNYVVGAVIFLILTIIQFLVIAKGSERVSEVAARFTLDAMPGKQMSIDADLRAGAFDLDEARKRRALVQKESQLYGAMDGAMKFVKGDAIAGVIITSINIVAGIVIGVMQRGMAAGDAAQVYTLLTIGDGLVSQIPALLIATTAGIIVTRVASAENDSHLGADIFGQILAQPKAIAITAVLLLILGIIPGLPTLPFLIMGSFIGFVAFRLYQAAHRSELDESDIQKMEEVESVARQGARQARALIPLVTPLTLDLGPGLSASMDDEQHAWFEDIIPRLREGFFYERGVKLPALRIRTEAPIGERAFVVSIDEIPVEKAEFPEDMIFVNEEPEKLKVFGIHATETLHPLHQSKASWVATQHKSMLEDAGVPVVDMPGFLIMRLTEVLGRHASEFVGIQEVQAMLEQLEGPYPAAVHEVVPKLLGLQQFTDILKRLAEEEVSIRNLRTILEILADRARSTKDSVELTEAVRQGLSRYITHKYSAADGSLVAYMIDRGIEDQVAGAIKVTDAGSFLALPPDITREILDAIGSEVSRDLAAGRTPILLTDQRVRRYLKRLASLENPRVVVLSYQELDPALKIQPIGRIRVGRR